MTDIHAQRILILDFGSQYTQLIARRVREIGVYCELWACDADPADIKAFAPNGVILSGGQVLSRLTRCRPTLISVCGMPV